MMDSSVAREDIPACCAVSPRKAFRKTCNGLYASAEGPLPLLGAAKGWLWGSAIGTEMRSLHGSCPGLTHADPSEARFSFSAPDSNWEFSYLPYTKRPKLVVHCT